ncbi:LOW QUALITY PROTEIN: olfactory receptor 11H6-like [Crocuta crocuta]
MAKAVLRDVGYQYLENAETEWTKYKELMNLNRSTSQSVLIICDNIIIPKLSDLEQLKPAQTGGVSSNQYSHLFIRHCFVIVVDNASINIREQVPTQRLGRELCRDPVRETLSLYLVTGMSSADTTTDPEANTCLSTRPMDHGPEVVPPSKNQKGSTPAQNPANSSSLDLDCIQLGFPRNIVTGDPNRGNFSLLEICYITTTVPNILANLLSTSKSLSFMNCFAQFYFFFSFGCDEGFFLCIMAFDRYLAICRPLHYPHIMQKQVYTGLAIFGWSCGFILFLTPVVLISHLPYCGPNTINHFMCDPVPLMMLSCSEDTTTQFIYSTFNAVFMIGNFLFVLCSYALVIVAVLRMPSAAGKCKAFSTCASHLAVVILYFGSVMVMYVSPRSGHPVKIQKFITLFYSVTTPLCNPLIYSLRNKEMKTALRKIFGTEHGIHKL